MNLVVPQRSEERREIFTTELLALRATMELRLAVVVVNLLLRSFLLSLSELFFVCETLFV
jgi:hypothetical protein